MIIIRIVNRVKYLVIGIILFAGCKEEIDRNQLYKELLLSNEIQRLAHLNNDEDLLTGDFYDTITSVQNGEVSVASKDQIKERFKNYFTRVKYTSWDDMKPPIIQISEDGSLASVIVQKLIDVQSVNEFGEFGEHEYIQFAWNAQYKSVDSHWKMYANISTRTALTSEEAMKLPIHFSDGYAVLDERDLIPEGVAYDNNTKITYLSSTYKQKIIAVQPDGSSSDFKTEQEDGLWSTIGMEVDESNNTLWVISSNANEALPMKYPDIKTEWTSKIYEYQLSSGELVNTYQPEIAGKYFFNDLCVSGSGRIYITESVQNKVYVLDPSNKSFSELPVEDSLFIFPNGIAISDDDRYLYIASEHGIVQYDIRKQDYGYLEKHSGVDDDRIDGLAYYKNTLIANQPYRNRILQYDLDEKNRRINHQRILEANHADFDQPSTGEVAGDSYIYLANAQMRSGFQNGRIKPDSVLNKVILLQAEIGH